MDKKCNHCRLNFSRKLSLTPTRLTFFRGARGNLYPKKKKGIRSSSYRVSNVSSSSSTKQWIFRGGDGKIPGFESSSAVIDYLPCTEELDSKSLFSRETKEISGRNVGKEPPTFDAFENDDDQREGRGGKKREK